MDRLTVAGFSGGARSWSKWMGWAAAGCSLLAVIAACSSEPNDPASSDLGGVGGASPRNEFAAAVDQARSGNGGGSATPSAQANPHLKNIERLQSADSAIQAPIASVSTKVLDLPAGGAPLPIVSSSASSYYDGRWPASASYDGDPTTFWMTAGNSTNEGKDYTPWVQYTFDQVYTLDRMRILNFTPPEYWRAAKDVEVLVSQDGTTFTSLGYRQFTISTGTVGLWQTLPLGGQLAKSVKFVVHTNYYFPRVFWRSPAIEGPWANASITGLNEVQFYATVGAGGACAPSCAGKTCGSDGCGGYCGGQLCTGSGCVVNADCAGNLVCSGVAPGAAGVSSICQPATYPSTCTNGVRDVGETDIDCGGACGPCAKGRTCEIDADCGSTRVCGQNNGAHFGLSRSARVCWDPSCDISVQAGGCGLEGSPCGKNCVGVTSCVVGDPTNPCAASEVCGAGLGAMFGSPSTDVCVNPTCPSNDPALCGDARKLCGPTCQSYSTIPIVSSSASSFYDWRFTPSSSYDGDPTTLWMTAGNSVNEGKDYTPWVQYTFDRAYTLQGMRLTNFPGYEYHRTAKDIEILVSQDGATFTSAGYKVFPLGSPVTSWLPSPATPWQSVDLADLGGQPVKSIKLAIHTNYYGGLFYGTPPQPPQETWANASVVGFPEVRFYTPDSTCSTDCSGKVCGRNGCGQTCGSLCTGAGCSRDSDCATGLVCSGYAAGGSVPTICQPTGYGSACTNGVRDWNETGVDCGGPCRACGPSTCTNGVRDGNETDVDCGGSCGACGAGHLCGGPADCQSGLICAGSVAGSSSATICTDASCASNPHFLGCGFLGAPCGPSCTPNPICTSNSNCPSGYICGNGNGYRYGVPGQNVCEPTNCPALGCGTTQSPCGLCACTPQCANKQCGDTDLSDGCGGICPSTCSDGNPAGCNSDTDCQAGSYCAFGQGARLGLADGSNVCMADTCKLPDISHVNCGTLLSKCGTCPPQLGECQGRQCGTDPVTGASCGGACADGQYCSAAGACVVPVPTPVITVKSGSDGSSQPIVPPTSPPAPGFGATPGTFGVTAMGSASYSVPIDVPPGRHGIEPNLALRYTSSTSNGTLGIGWSLDGLSTISLCPRTYAQDGQAKPVSLSAGEALCLDGQRLVLDDGGSYRTENDTFIKIDGYDNGNEQGKPTGYTAYTKDGRILYYEQLANWKGNGGGRWLWRTWALTGVTDRDGNFMRIVYRQTTSTDSQDLQWPLSSTELVPDSIIYTGNGNTDGDREVKFEYSDSRPDKLLGFQIGGGILARTVRLEHIKVLAGGSLVRRYDLNYETASNNASRLKTLQECAGPSSICKGATTFKYKTDQGFGAGVPYTPPIVNGDLDSGAPEFLAPYGTPVGNRYGYDVLVTQSDNATSIPTQPIPGGADMAVQAIPVAGQIAGAIIDLINLFGSSSYLQHWFVEVIYDFKDKHYGFGGRCFQRERSTQHVIRNTYGGEGTYDTCAGEPLTFFVDVDGDGVQDRLNCSDGGQQVAYYLAKNHGHATPEDLSQLPTPDGKVAALSNFCADQEAWDQWAATLSIFSKPPEPPKPPFIGAYDVDGDGTGNLFFKDATGITALFFDGDQPAWRRLSTDAMPLELAKRYVSFLDANGDGLRDILALPSKETPDFQTPVLWLNTGVGFRQTLLSVDAVADAMAPPLGAYVVDYDHDGVDDLIEAAPANGTTAQPWFIRRFNNGKLTKQQITDPGPGYPGALGDFDGDGNLDLLTRKPGTIEYFMHYGKGRLQNALESVIDGFDRRVDIQYDIMNPEGDHTYTPAFAHYSTDTDDFVDNGTQCQWPNRCAAKMDHLLVSSYRESHRETAGAFILDKDTRLSYHGEIDDMGGLGPLGFEGQLTTIRDAGGALLKQIRRTNLALPSSSAQAPIETPYHRTLVGLPDTVSETGPLVSSALSPQGTISTQSADTTYHWIEKTSASGRPFAALQSSKTTISDYIQGFWYAAPTYERQEVFVVDGYGNTTDHVVSATDLDHSNTAAPSVPGSTSTYYEQNTFNPTEDEVHNWQISLLKAQTISDQPRCYGGATSCTGEKRTRHTDFTYYNSGKLHTITRAAGDVTAQAETTFGRDAFGNVNQVDVLDATGDLRTTLTRYDDRGLFPISTTNRLGRKTQVRFDDRFGKLTVRVDPNEIAETWAYDDFGVLRDYQGPGGEEKTDYEPDGTTSAFGLAVMAKYRVIKQKVGGSRLVQRFNSLGQIVARESSGLNGATVIEEFGYDQRDRLSIASRPHLPSDQTQGLIQYSYDEFDRLLTQSFPNGSVVHQDHAQIYAASDEVKALAAGLLGVVSVARVTDPKTHSTYQFFDRDGRTLSIVDANSKATLYQYGAFGSLEHIIAPNATLSYAYDNFGRLLSASDPAVGGARTVTYNGLDEVVTTIDPAGRQSSLLYDELGRRKTLTNADGTTTWTYDEGPNAIGRLSGMLSATGQKTSYGFEAPSSGSNRGLLETVTRSVVSPNASTSLPPTVLTTTYHYDQFSRLAQIDYPGDSTATLSVNYGFDAAGHVTSVSDAADSSNVYWQLTGAKQGYLPSFETFGNGVTTERQYEDLTGYLSSITTKHGSTLIQQMTYGGYDPNGNLGHRTDGLTGVTEYFGYDNLDRVTSTSYGGAYSPEPYAYDPMSNGLSLRGNLGNYTYAPSGRDWIKTAGGNEYTQDSLGRVQTRSGQDVPGGTQEFSYTTFDLPSHVSLQTDPGGGIDFAYDANGARVLKKSSSQTTFYAGDLYQRMVSSLTTGATSQRFMIYAGGRAIAAVFHPEASGPGAIEYLHDDSLGSIQAATASDASVVENRHFDAFGTAWGPASWAQVPFGFTGQEQDSELNLVNMGGRIYDPLIGQFLSADPLIQQPFSQGLNRFAYVNNNPLSYTDPSGFDAEDVSVGSAIGVGVGYFTGLAVHLLTYSEAAGTAATTTAAVPAVADTALAGAGAGVATAGEALAAVGTGAAVASSVFFNVLMTARQPTSTIATAQATTRSATAPATGPAPLGRGGFAISPISATTEPGYVSATRAKDLGVVDTKQPFLNFKLDVGPDFTPQGSPTITPGKPPGDNVPVHSVETSDSASDSDKFEKGMLKVLEAGKDVGPEREPVTGKRIGESYVETAKKAALKRAPKVSTPWGWIIGGGVAVAAITTYIVYCNAHRDECPTL